MRAPQRARRVLEGLGFEDVRLNWHWPNFERCGQIIPLDASGVVAYALEQRPNRRSARVRTLRDRIIGALGLLPTLAPAVSIIARAPAHRDCRDAIVNAAMRLVPPAELGRRGLASGVQALLITPRFRTSRHIVAVLFPPGAQTPELVAKLPRLAGDNEAVAVETLVLSEVAARGAPTEAIPRVVGFGEAGDRSLLVQSALVGRLLTSARLRKDPDRHIGGVLTWLEQLARATGTLDGLAAWQTSVALPLEAFAAASRGDEEAALVRRTLELTAPLIEARIRVGVQHGDLSHPNLILLDGGGVGVVDWELADLHGLPLQDACYFLAYAVFARARARGVAEELAAFDKAFVRPGGWAARELGAFARRTSVPNELVTPLFVACWARAAVRMRDRVELGSAGDPGRWVRESRYYVLWRHALEHASQLQWEA
jgi:hypothetical protein